MSAYGPADIGYCTASFDLGWSLNELSWGENEAENLSTQTLTLRNRSVTNFVTEWLRKI